MALPLNLETLQSEAAKYLDLLGVDYEKLTSDELGLFDVSFERQFVLAFPQREVVDIFARHKREVLMGLMIARGQMDAAFDGMFPGSNKIGMGEIRACYLGIGDDWEDITRIYGGAQGYWNVGTPQPWISSGTTYLGGSSSNPVRIEENQVTVAVAIGSKHVSPKLESVYLEIDGKAKPIIPCHFATRMVPYGAIPIKEFDDALILHKNKEILARVFFSDAFGETVSKVIDFPYLLGVSFIREPELRVQDPYDLVGTAAFRATHKLVVPTS